MASKKEAQARIRINKLLEQAGWRFFDDENGRASISCEHRVTKKKFRSPDELGNDFENSNGFIDYLLLNNEQKPVALVEAKSEKIHPLEAKEQAREYAKSLGIRYVFLSNGIAHYYWDLNQGNPTRISYFLTLEQLGEALTWSPDPKKLFETKVEADYIALSQDAQWRNYSDAEKKTVKLNKDIKLLRDYQLEAVKVLQKQYRDGQNRFLFEMATGTGKTLLSAAITKLFIRSGNANRVLFLVDRLELENQASKSFNHYLDKDGISSVIYKEDRDNWRNAQVVITTIQSLAYDNRYIKLFSPNDFQLIISDEAHRTINGNNRAIFEYFIGAKLGLTATPKDYLKGIDIHKLSDNDPRQLELRLLMDTYRTFGCENGVPTFRYSLLDAVQHDPPYLVNPKKIDARTSVTTQMLSEKGWSTKLVVTENEDEDTKEETFFKRDFEKKFFSPETNLTFVRTFLANAKRDPITGEIGKSIVFAVSRHHARKLTTLLNEEIEKMYPGVYDSDFSVQVTSNISGAQQMTINFSDSNNNLNGRTRFKPELIDYESSKTRVCVTVGMMTTGYDCQDLLNVVLCRPIFSPTDFIQIKGRGTRLYDFEYHNGNEVIGPIKKDNFFLFDFFANCEYFEKEFDYDRKIELPKPGGEGGDGPIPPPPPPGGYVYTGPDNLEKVEEQQVGTDGMRVDREAFSRGFEDRAREEVRNNPELVKALETESWDRIEAYIKANVFDKPKEYWNTDKLREAYGVDRRLTLIEILKKVFGKIDRFKTKEDIAGDYFERFLSEVKVDLTKVEELRQLFIAYLLYGEIRNILDEKEYPKLSTDSRLSLHHLKELGPEQVKLVLDYIKDNVPLNQFLT